MTIKVSHIFIFSLSFSFNIYANDYKFDLGLLGENKNSIDIGLLNEGGQLPGNYTVDILLNGEIIETKSINFFLKDKKLTPCIGVEDLVNFGVNVNEFRNLSSNDGCVEFYKIPFATTDFDFSNQRVNINIPQVYMSQDSSELEKVALWDEGISAARVNYKVSTKKTLKSSLGYIDDNSFGQLNPGLNIGSWRIRNQTNWSRNDNGSKFQSAYTYAERGITSLKSRISLGERATPGDIFDSVPFIGLMIGTDENMIPSSQRSFAPVVRGIARTQAQIEIVQNGYVVYNTTVAPGPFEIADLSSSTASNGELSVTIKESDGSKQFFTVPYQTPAISVRKGYLGYNIVAARYRSADSGVDSAPLIQGSVIYGLPWNITLYTGLQMSENYNAKALGLGSSLLEFGSISVDVLTSNAKKNNHEYGRGAAWRTRYTKSLTSTNSSFSFSSTKYTNEKYISLADYLDSSDQSDNFTSLAQATTKRRKRYSSVQLRQRIGNYGFLNLNGSRTDYINSKKHDNNIGASFSSNISGVSFSLGLSFLNQFDENGSKKNDRILSMLVSIPLGILHDSKNQLTYQASSSSKNENNHDIGLNGYAYEDQLYWDIHERFNGKERSNSVYTNWSGQYGKLGGNFSHNSTSTSVGTELSGGMVLHENGLTFTQYLGDTIALVEAPGAADVKVNSFPGIRTDKNGYTAVTNVSPYQENTISLDPTSLSYGIDLSHTDRKVVPTSGAVVSAKFMPRIGEKVLMTLVQENGDPIPFGSVVLVDGAGSSIAAEGGKVYLTGLLNEGRLTAKWKDGGQCKTQYNLSNDKLKNNMHIITVKCLNAI